MEQHLACEEICHFPVTLGGIGELQFIKNVKQLGSCFVLYHGITNLLRLGDLTFINLNTMKIAGLGELKTVRKSETEISVQLTVISPKAETEALAIPRISDRVESEPIAFPEPAGSHPNAAGVQMRDRFARQLSRMRASFKQKVFDESLKSSIEGRSTCSEVESLVKQAEVEGLGFSRISDGLVVVAVKNDGLACLIASSGSLRNNLQIPCLKRFPRLRRSPRKAILRARSSFRYFTNPGNPLTGRHMEILPSCGGQSTPKLPKTSSFRKSMY